MNFDLTEDQLALSDGVRRFVSEQYSFELQRQRVAAAKQTDRAMWTRFSELGWLGILVPEDCGGLGMAVQDAVLVLHEFGRGLVAEPYLDSAMLAVQLLVRTGTQPAREILTKIVGGEMLVAVALLESNARYRFESSQSVLERTPNGYTLSGAKIHIEGGDVADGYLLSATYGGELALTYVPADSLGVTRVGYRMLDGAWAGDVTLKNVALREQQVLATGQQARDALNHAIDVAALGAAAQSIGCMDRILELTADYLGSRKQFGQTLASFQVLQHRVADLFVEVEMARSAFYGGLAVIDEDDASKRSAAVSAARVRVDQAALRVGTQGIHLHGGVGMTVEYPVGHFYRKLLRLTRMHGDIQHHLDRYERLEVRGG